MFIPELIRKEGLRQGLRPNTITTYCVCVEKFLRICRKESYAITKKDIQDYLDRLLERNAPGSTINVYLNALKFFYEQVLHRKLTLNIRFSKTRRQLPDCLTKEETIKIFDAIPNEKHRLMIRFLYSSGLRISEFCHLRVQDVHLEENYGWVRDGKGGKDRPFVIAQTIKEELQQWIKLHGLLPHSWLFPGYKSRSYSDSSIREILWAAKKKAGITKRVYPHLLRHSFATHFIINGYSPLELQPLLGHSRLDTTMMYVHTAAQHLLNVHSPLDSLVETAPSCADVACDEVRDGSSGVPNRANALSKASPQPL